MPNTKLFLIVLYQIGIWEFKKEKKKTGKKDWAEESDKTTEVYTAAIQDLCSSCCSFLKASSDIPTKHSTIHPPVKSM